MTKKMYNLNSELNSGAVCNPLKEKIHKDAGVSCYVKCVQHIQ